jgi:hypothetical protein
MMFPEAWRLPDRQTGGGLPVLIKTEAKDNIRKRS